MDYDKNANSLSDKELVARAKTMIEQGEVPKPGSPEYELLQRNLNLLLSFFPNSNGKQMAQEKKPSLLERIKTRLAYVKTKVDSTLQREFRWRQFRRFKDYSTADYLDERFIKRRWDDQQRKINLNSQKLENIEPTADNAKTISMLRSARDEAQRKLNGMRKIMKGEKGFAFIEEQNGVGANDKNIDKLPVDYNNPNYLKMIAGRGQGLGEFRTSYKRVVRSERKHATSAIVGAGLFAIAYCAFYASLSSLDPALLDATKGPGLSGLINQILPAIQDGFNKLKSISTTSDIGEVLQSSSTGLVLSAQAAAVSAFLTIRQLGKARKDKFERTQLEDQNYLNIGDDVDDVARRM